MLNRPALVRRFGLSPEEIAAFIRVVVRRAIIVEPADSVPVAVRDPKDIHVLATAVAGRAQYLVTGDDDLLALAGHEALGSLQILTPRAFLATLHQKSDPAQGGS